jgi:hypothetical protein
MVVENPAMTGGVEKNSRVDPLLQESVDNFLNENLIIVPYNIRVT